MILIISVLLSACDREKSTDAVTSNLGCKGTAVIEKLQPNAGVTFVAAPPGPRSNTLPWWRAAVGPAVVDRANRSCESAALDSVLVVSWNVNVGHGDVARFISDLRNGLVLPGVKVRHFVMLVQEAKRESDAIPERARKTECPSRIGGSDLDIEALSDSLGLALFYVPSMRNGCEPNLPREDRGNAILSTLPLSNLKAVELPVVRQRRVAAIADVKGHNSAGTEWTLTVATTHFENRGPGRPRDWRFGRAKQAEALVAALPETPLMVVGGDFNTLDGVDEEAVRIISGRFSNTPEHQTKTTYVKYSVVRSHLDYLFFRSLGDKPGRYWRARSRYDSDHFPIMGFVRVG
ncbi:MAG TPA: endonuclease/exonuclease/phosphatase family protein [Longimicrobiales bacterium]|nr:endonuclease/exonuclease/phosphatase family protein [Longimicrobiales bacterium]